MTSLQVCYSIPVTIDVPTELADAIINARTGLEIGIALKKIKALCVEAQPILKYYDDVAVIEDIFLEETDTKIY